MADFEATKWLNWRPLPPPELHKIPRALVTLRRVCRALIRVFGDFSLPLMIAVACLASVATAQAAPDNPASTPVVNSYDELWQLGQAGRTDECRVRGRMYVLCYMPEWKVLWVWWGGKVNYLDAGPTLLPIASGQWIDLTGFALPGTQRLLWEKTRITIVPSLAPPEPAVLRADLSNLDDVAMRPAAIEGVVDEQLLLDERHVQLNVVFGGTNVVVYLPIPPKDPIPQFTGTIVRATGTLSVKRDVGGVEPKLEFWCANPTQIRVTGLLARDERFTGPSTAIEKIVVKPDAPLTHVVGVVHRQEPGRLLILRDGTGQIEILTHQRQYLREGESVEAIGRPARDGIALVLRDGLYRRNTATAAVAPGSLLRLSDQVRSLAPSDLAAGVEARISGVVTWSSPHHPFFFMGDATGGLKILLPSDKKLAPPLVGSGLIVPGKVRAGGFVPALEASALLPGDNIAIHEAETISWEQAMAGGEYGNWVDMQAYVRSVTRSKDECSLDLTAAGGEFTALVPSDVSEDLAGAIVRVRGVCDAIANDRRQLIGFRLLVPQNSDVRIVEPAPVDPFTTPAEALGNLLRYNAHTALERRVQVHGTVLLQNPGQVIYLQDGSDTLLVLSRQRDELHPGDRVAVVGIPGQDGSRLIMREAIFRREGTAALPDPARVDATAAPQAQLDGSLVTLSGRLLNFDRTSRGILRLQLQAGPRIFSARLEGGTPAQLALEAGSRLALTGVYRVELDEYRRPRGAVVHLRSMADIAVLARPPWWTVGRFIWLAAGLLTAALLALGWGLMVSRKNRQLWRAELDLRRANEELEARVAARTQDLSAEVEQRRASETILSQERLLLRTLIDNLPAYLYVKDTTGRFVIDNLPHTRLLGARTSAEVVGRTEHDFWPADIADVRRESDRRVMETGEPLILHEEPYLIGEQRGWHSTTKVPLRDANGRITGLIAIAQDITTRKEVEADRENLHRQLLETSRQAGMAEVATGVLHNIGNVLNSVNVSATVAADIIARSKAEKLRVPIELLAEHQSDLPAFFAQDRRAHRIPAYLEALAEQLRGEQAEVLKELKNLQHNIDHIKEVVAMQQTYAKISGVTEKIAVTEIVEDALRLNADGLVRHRIEIVRNFRSTPMIVVERHKVLQILVNLISNAKYACDGSTAPQRQVTVMIEEAAGTVRIAVEDNGVGIRAENLTRIFSHGFTTRKGGHGFGLHSGAIAAKDIGGVLRVASEGEGRGATFTLELPLSPDQGAAPSGARVAIDARGGAA